MTENEIIDFLEDEINGLEEQKNGDMGEIAAEVFKEINGDERIKVFRTTITVLKEIQQYREIGTVKECRELASIVNKVERNELAKIIDEWISYRKIGTVEECREAVEKQRTKKIIIRDWNPTKCPTCGHELSTSLGDGYYKHPIFLERCPECGQAIQWDNLEGMEDE